MDLCSSSIRWRLNGLFILTHSLLPRCHHWREKKTQITHWKKRIVAEVEPPAMFNSIQLYLYSRVITRIIEGGGALCMLSRSGSHLFEQTVEAVTVGKTGSSKYSSIWMRVKSHLVRAWNPCSHVWEVCPGGAVFQQHFLSTYFGFVQFSGWWKRSYGKSGERLQHRRGIRATVQTWFPL